jgi:hypothetical protein
VDRESENKLRSQQSIALSSGGRSLLDLEEGGIPSPCELLDTILHAIIGEYCSHISASTHTLLIIDLGRCNLFLGGVLHRDISSGKVLRYAEPVKCPALERCARVLAFLGQRVLTYSTGSRVQRMIACQKVDRLPHSLQLITCFFLRHVTIRVYTTPVGLASQAVNRSHGCG